VLVFNNAASLGNGAPADNVLGQMNFTSGGSGLSATQLNQPFGMFYDPTADVLWVADSLNNRVVA
jgi:DNA-binding beta-propeller fold protein YncE